MNNSKECDMARSQRLIDVINELIKQGAVYNYSDFATKIGKSKSFVSERTNGKRTITERFAQEISKVFSQINKNYLMNGQGTPVIAATNTGNQYTVGDNAKINLRSGIDSCTSIEQCIQLLRNAQKTIDLLIKQRDDAQIILNRTQDQLTKAQEQVDKLLSLLAEK